MKKTSKKSTPRKAQKGGVVLVIPASTAIRTSEASATAQAAKAPAPGGEATPRPGSKRRAFPARTPTSCAQRG